MRDVRRFGFHKFGVREHDAELVIQLMEQQTELWIRIEIFHAGAVLPYLLGRMPRRDGVRHMRAVPVRAGWPRAGVAPQ
jgi:hypothetical protein